MKKDKVVKEEKPFKEELKEFNKKHKNKVKSKLITKK